MNETREEQLINAGKAAEADKKVDVEALKKKYAASEEKVYTVVTRYRWMMRQRMSSHSSSRNRKQHPMTDM